MSQFEDILYAGEEAHTNPICDPGLIAIQIVNEDNINVILPNLNPTVDFFSNKHLFFIKEIGLRSCWSNLPIIPIVHDSLQG